MSVNLLLCYYTLLSFSDSLVYSNFRINITLTNSERKKIRRIKLILIWISMERDTVISKKKVIIGRSYFVTSPWSKCSEGF